MQKRNTIHENNHPYSQYHKGHKGGHSFWFNDDWTKLEGVVWESYCGHGGGGMVWNAETDTQEALNAIIQRCEFSDQLDAAKVYKLWKQ